jgi:hypothetical protein
MYWIMIGPGLLVLLLLLMAMQKETWLEGIDFAFAVFLLLVIISRWVDFLYADPTLTTGEVATSSQIRNHSLFAVIIGLGSWITATLLGLYVLG